MTDNLTMPFTGSGDATAEVATDEVQVGGTQDLAHVQYVKLVDGTLNGTDEIASGGGAEAKAMRVTFADGSPFQDVFGASSLLDAGSLKVAVAAQKGTVDATNSSTTPLGGSGTFTGTGVDVLPYAAIVVNVFADEDSATDGLEFQWSSNNTNWDIKDAYSVTANEARSITVNPRARYFRVVYTNRSGQAQGAFRLQTILNPVDVAPRVRPLDELLAEDAPAAPVRAVVTARRNDDTFQTVRMTNGDNLRISIQETGVTVPVSASSLPLPTGAATEATLGAVDSKLGGTIAVSNATLTSLAAAINASKVDVNVVGTVPVSGTFWQTTQPVSGTVTANAGTGNFGSNITQIAGNTVAAGSGVNGTGVQRVTIATDQAAIAVTPAANSAVNVAQMNGVAPTMGSGGTGTGVQRVTQATDVNVGSDLKLIGGNAIAVGSGVNGTGVQRVTVATDQAAIPVTPAANSAVNVAQMNAVAVSMGSGVVGTGVQRVVLPTDQPAVAISAASLPLPAGAATAANQLASGHNVTLLASTGQQEVVGDVASGVAMAGNPLAVGLRANATEPTAVAAGQSVYGWSDLFGAQIVVQNHPAAVAAADTHGPKTTTLTTTSNVALVAAPGGGQSIHVTGLVISNTHATTSVLCEVKDGTTARWPIWCSADGGGGTFSFNPPWKITANTALNGALGANVTDVRVGVHYYVAP